MKPSPHPTQGGRIPLFGSATGRHAMRNRDSNVLVRILNALLNLRVVSGSKNELIVADQNAVLSLDLGKLLQPGLGSLIPCEITDFSQNDVLVCNRLDVSPASSLVVAKPYHLRKSTLSETIQGVAYTYVYSSAVLRTANGTAQAMVRDYQVGNIVWALPAVTGLTYGGADVNYLDISGYGRDWFRDFHFKDANDSCVEKKAWIHMTEPVAV